MELQKRSMFIFAGIVLLAGCSATPPVQKVADSQSQFDDAVYKGETVEIEEDNSGAERYRVFSQGATGFVPQSAVRSNAEDRAIKFCERQDKKAKILQERKSTFVPLPGNFPRSELVFVCADVPLRNPSFDDVQYIKLKNLKKLLDEGVLTKQEFESQKAKVLGEK